jgi:DNA uptake protein ComE-like DNA-binding protein
MAQRNVLMGLAFIAAVAAAACGGSSKESTSSQAAATPAASSVATGPDVAPTSAAQAQPAATATPPTTSAQANAKLNLNTATREQFLTVPNVGDRMVREFMEYRPYRSILQFRREIGKYVSQDQVAAYEKYVFVPVDPNQADAETLRQLPGVDAGIATQLIAARPYASADAFLAKLGQLVSTDQAAAARAYLAVS